MKKLVSILTACVFAVSLMAGCSSSNGSSSSSSASASASASASTSASAAGDKTFKVGFDAEYPPYGYMDENGQYTGFDLELAQKVCEINGWTYEAVPINWDSKDMELSSGSIDCIWNGFTMTGREDEYTWSEPYMENSQVVVVMEDSGIETLEDLAGKIVEVQADSSAEAALKEMPDLTSTFGTLQTTPDYNTAFMDLEMGSVDAIAMDVIVAGYQMQEREGSFKILEESLASEEYAIGFKKGNTELCEKVQQTLEEMAADGTMAEISEKWFGEDITTVGK